MRPLDAYHGNHHTFWPRLYSAHGRHSRRGLASNFQQCAPLPQAPASPSSGTSDSTVAKAMEYRPSDIGVGSDGRTFPRLLAESRGADAGVGSPPSPSDLIPASIFEVATVEGREAAKERARL